MAQPIFISQAIFLFPQHDIYIQADQLEMGNKRGRVAFFKSLGQGSLTASLPRYIKDTPS